MIELAPSTPRLPPLAMERLASASKLPDSTEEFSAQDVLDMLDVAASSVAERSAPSLAPVGIDAEPFDLVRLTSPAARRRTLLRLVAGGFAASAAVLALVATRLMASSPPTGERVSFAAQASPSDATGQIRFETPAGWAWLDGEPVTANVVRVPCGPHRVQIGGQLPSVVAIPCGGEVVVHR